MPKAAPYLLAWSIAQQSYMLAWRANNEMLDLVPESPAWFAWLDEAPSFTFQGKAGAYTARKESIRQGDTYWYAYMRTGEKLLKKYVGKTTEVTLARLEQVAGALSADRDTRLRARHEERSQQTQIDAHSSGASLERGDGADVDRTPQTSSVQRDPLLATKLYVPRPRTQLVHRSHLIERLQQSMECTLTLVSAPAGFGKTTLLAQWLAESGTPVAWLSLEPEDNDPVRFLTYLIAALQTRNPQLGVNILEMLEASQSTPLESALIVLSNDIINRQIADFVLVLDDYHTIASESIDRAMTFLIEHLPPQVHLILATRADPPLPLSRLRARRQLVELRAADLRMNSAETNTLLHTVMGLDLSDEAISTLESRTEGWVAGLQLAALSLHGRRDISTFLAAFSGSHRFVLDYLSEEVLSRQSASVLSFLLQTSILERLSGPLCDAVTVQEGGQAMLESIEQANLFTNALDEERRWYRYHHLFAEVLRRRLQQAQPLLVPELHRRASLWYEQHEQPIEAVSHALAAEDVERAARLIEQYGMLVIARGQTRTLLEWLNALPHALVRTRPLLCICYAAALHLIDQVEEAETCLHDAERAISSQTQAEQTRNIRGIAASVSANIARYSGNVSRYVSLGQQSYKLLPESNLMLRATAGMQAAYTYLVNGDVTPTMEKKVRIAVTAASTSGYSLVHFRSLTMLARLQVLQGRMREAALTYEEAGRATQGTQVLQVLTASATYCFGLADLLREWNRLDDAERLLFQGMELVRGKKSSFADDILLGYLTKVRLQYARGAYGEALATVDAFIHLAGTRHFVPQLQATAAALRVHIALTMGNLTEALHWAVENGLSRNDAELSYLREREYLTMVRVSIAQGREEPAGQSFEDALYLLDRLLQEAEAKARLSSVLEILILQALALHARGDRASSHSTLKRALELAEPEGYIRLFVDEGTPIQTLLGQIHPPRHDSMQGYVATLLSAFGGQPVSSAPRHSPLLEPLTGREREVLRLLLQGDSNREIARRLVLSINTVKRHIYNICGKLGVQSRAQAIVKAGELNLV